jgi:hypothetical protein
VNDRTDDVGSGLTNDPQQGPAQPQQQNQQAGAAQPQQQQQVGVPGSTGGTTRAGETSSRQQVSDGPDQDQDDIGEPPDPCAGEEPEKHQHSEEVPETDLEPPRPKEPAEISEEKPEEEEPATQSNYVSIREEIRALREAMSTAISGKLLAEGVLAAQENRLSVLEQVERDFPVARKAYDDAYPQLRRNEDDLIDYIKDEKKSVAAHLGVEGVKKVACRVVEFLTQERDLKKAVDDAKIKAKKPADPNAEVARYTSDLAAWKKITATLTAQQGEIRALREEIVKARLAGHYGLALWLLWKAELRRKEFLSGCGPYLVLPTDLQEKLYRAAKRLADAQKKAAEAQRVATENEAALAAAIANLDKHQKTAEPTLQEDLKDLDGDDPAQVESAERAQLGAQ